MGIGDLFVLLLVALIAIILSPIIIPLAIYAYFQEKLEKQRFERFLKTSEGRKFFCYTARQTSVDYVRAEIIPFLPSDTTIIYLGDSKKIFSMGEDVPFLDRLIATMRMTKGGYPYVSKVCDSKLQTISINNQLYSAIRRSVDATTINQKLIRFLECDSLDKI